MEPPPYPLEGRVEEVLKRAGELQPSGATRDLYLDLAEPFVRVAAEHLREDGALLDPYWDDVESPTGAARFVGAAAPLIGAGRCIELVEQAALSMDHRTEALHRSSVSGERLLGPDFETRDLMLGGRFISPHVDARRAQRWRKRLGGFDPETVYVDVLSQRSAEQLYNWNVYALCGEWLKFCDGVADNRQWIERYLALQFPRFNAHGLYRDPDCPFTYDLTVRQGLSWMLANGYDGEHLGAVRELLRRGALTMLLYLSPLGQAPYGGRSNQFHHNEAMAACVCEFEARRYAQEGNLHLAGAFKRQARLCAQATKPWLLGIDPPRHLKNRYPPETRRGCDDYGHYLVYGLLAANLFGVAHLMADEAIEEFETPAEIGGTLLHLPQEGAPHGGYHKVFAGCGGYHLEVDTKGQPGQDATGLGRLHRAGVPSWATLTAPAAANPGYVIGAQTQEVGAAACAAWREEGGAWQSIAEAPRERVATEVLPEKPQADLAAFTVVHLVDSTLRLEERYELAADGLTIGVKTKGDVAALGYCLPVPVFDGEAHATTETTPTSLNAVLDGGRLTVECLDEDSQLVLTDRICENRTGALALYRAEGIPFGVRVRLSLTPAGEAAGAEDSVE